VLEIRSSTPTPAARPFRFWLAKNLPLLLVLALGLALRLVALHAAGDMPRLPGDEDYYVRMARAIEARGEHPGSYRGPGHPFFMALVFRLAGPENLNAVRVAGILLSVLSVALVFHVVSRQYSRRAALWSALATALSPNLIHFSFFLWSETLFTALLLAVLWLLQRYDDAESIRDLAVAGVVLGLAVLTRESILPFTPVVLAWLLLRPAPLAQRLRRAALFAFCLLLPILPWTIRNYRVHHTLVLVSTCRWYPMALGNQTGELMRRELSTPRAEPLDEARAEAHWRELALAGIRNEQPLWIFRKIARNVPSLLSPCTQLVYFVGQRWYPQYSPLKRHLLLSVEIGGHVLLLLLGTLGLCLARGGRVKTLVLLFIAYTFCLHIVANSCARFLLPLLPFACLYIGPLIAGGTLLVRTPARRLLAAVLATLVVAIVLSRISDASSAWNLRPNVLLISVDGLRADHLHSYGYPRPTSPHLDRLAGEGTLFERTISPTAWTLPAHASLLSGMLPVHHGAVTTRARIAFDLAWLPEQLQRARYATQAVVNASLLDEQFGFARGFGSYAYVPKADWKAHQAAALAALADQGTDRPFFLFVQYMAVHAPYRPPPGFDVFAGPDTSKLPIEQRDREFPLDLYDGAILGVDARIHELLFQLQKMRIDENTIVLVTADHGEEFLDHGSLSHGRTLFEEQIRVPLIARGPGVPSGRRDACLATLMDVAPTVIALTGAPASKRSNGINLSRLWSGGACPAREIELYTSEPDGSGALHGLRTEREKLIIDMETGRRSFFDLLRDPDERLDLYPNPAARPLEDKLLALPVPQPVLRPGA